MGQERRPVDRHRNCTTTAASQSAAAGAAEWCASPPTMSHENVEPAYATTAHRAQGRTVDTAHAIVSPASTREVLYVSATRGRESNKLYVDVAYDPDPASGHPGTVERTHPGAGVARRARQLRACRSPRTPQIREEWDKATGLEQLIAEYQTFAQARAGRRAGSS